MPDPLSHLCLSYLLGRAARLRRGLCLFLLGAMLPDLITALPVVLLGGWGYWFFAPAHMPVGVLLVSYALSMLFVRSDRRLVFAALVGGGFLSLGLDLLQNHLAGGYMLFFPFWWGEFELGLVGPEESLGWLPWLVPVSLLAVFLDWLTGRAGGGRRQEGGWPGPIGKDLSQPSRSL